MGACLPLSRVLSLVGGLGLVAAFFMPWFATQGVLLSGQFLDTFLATATPADLQRFLPDTTQSNVRLLRLLVDLFPVCGTFAAAVSLIGSLAVRTGRLVVNLLLAVDGVIPLAAWAAGTPRLPPGSTFEVGLGLIVAGSLAVLIGSLLDVAFPRA